MTESSETTRSLAEQINALQEVVDADKVAVETQTVRPVLTEDSFKQAE